MSIEETEDIELAVTSHKYGRAYHNLANSEIANQLNESKDEANEITYDKKEVTASEKEPEPANLSEMLSFADRKDKLAMTLGIFAAILSGLNQPAQLIVFGNLLNSFNTGGDGLDKINFLSLMYLILGIQMFICQFLQTFCMVFSASRQIKNMREAYFKSLLSQNIAYFDEVNQGEMATSVIESTLIIQEGLGEKLALGIQSLFAFIFGFAVALYYAWQLTLLLLAIIPVMIGIVGFAVSFGPKASSSTYNAAGLYIILVNSFKK